MVGSMFCTMKSRCKSPFQSSWCCLVHLSSFISACALTGASPCSQGILTTCRLMPWSSFFGRPDPVPTFPYHHQSSIVPQLSWGSIGRPRGEVYVRPPFVDDLCLHGAMQGFLTRGVPSQGKINKETNRSS